MNQQNAERYVSESRFYMWRAIFAVAHVDGIVTIEEADFLSKCFSMDNFSSGQREILMRDMGSPQDISKMFSFVSDDDDKVDFFIYAEDLGASDGDFCGKERRSINALKKKDILGFPPSLLKEKIRQRRV